VRSKADRKKTQLCLLHVAGKRKRQGN